MLMFDIVPCIATNFFTISSLNLLITGTIMKSQMHSKLYNLPQSYLYFSAED